MDTLLVAIDFSAASRTASLYAASLAKAARAKLILFHAYMLPAPVSEVPYVMVSVDEMQIENEKLVRSEAEVLHRNFDIEVEGIVQIGLPSDEITSLAAERNAALIVTGMRGAGGIDKLIGSTTASVVRKSKTPVLVVPHTTIFSPVEQIVYASDFSYTSSGDLFKPLTDLAGLFQSTIHIVHIRRMENNEKKEKEELAKNVISSLLGNIRHEFSVIADDSIMHGINGYIEQHNVQMLVMVAHKHSFFERLFSKIHTTAMTYETKIPLLVLQDKI
ncbi:MAG TPA: universal stress protein [Flavitalea sp.]|nr:universal stress protein [Flavitalea sp.]